MNSQRVATLLLLALTLFVGIAPAHAATKGKSKRAPARRHGLYVAIDPVTHRPIAPTPEQLRAWNDQRATDALTAPARPLAVQKLPNGGEIVHLNGAFRSYSIARRDAHGTFTTDCAPDTRTAKQLLQAPLPAGRTPEVK